MKYILLLCLSVATFFANAQKVNPPAVKSTAFYNKAMLQIKPVYKNYITQTAKALRYRKLNADSLKKTIKAANNSGSNKLNDADAETVAMMIMQAAETQAYADINNMMDEMQKTRQKKEALSKEEDIIKAAQRKTADSIKNGKLKMNLRVTDQAKRLAAIKNEKDAMDEMNQQDMLQLQQLMEQKSQLEQMISNVMKANSDTQSGLSGNLKAS